MIVSTRVVAAPAALALLLVLAAPQLSAGRSGDVRVQSFELLNRGVAAYNRGEYTAAVEALRQSASMALNSFRAHYYLGLALIGERQYSAALEALAVALDLDPDHLQALIAQGDALLKLGNVDESRAAYHRALKLRPAFAPALDGIARTYESQAATDKAIEQFRAAIASNKGFAPAYTHLGDLYLQQGRLEEAVRLLEEAITIRPDYAPGMSRLALAYGRLGLDNEAVALVREAIELEPNNAEHLVTLGELQLGQSRVNAAEASFERALALDPGLPEAERGLAEVARRRGDYDAALARVDAALADPGLSAGAVLKLQAYRAVVARERQSFAELEARSAAGEATVEDRSALAAIYAGRERWELAVEQLERLPPSLPARERLAYALFRAGRYREASGVYGALAGEAGSLDDRLNHGVTLAALGDDARAIEAYESVLRDDPSHRPARLYLGNALLRSGRPKEAAAAYKGFLDLGQQGEAAERVRRILKQIAPELLPEPAIVPKPPPPPEDSIELDLEQAPES